MGDPESHRESTTENKGSGLCCGGIKMARNMARNPRGTEGQETYLTSSRQRQEISYKLRKSLVVSRATGDTKRIRIMLRRAKEKQESLRQ